MGIADRLKDAAKKAEEQASEHKDQIRQVVEKAGAAADQRTGGRYSEQIQGLATRAQGAVDRVAGESHAPAESAGAADSGVTPPEEQADA
jgi:hypothetical protein